MGRYFGLYNRTRKQGVSEGRFCWKADPNCDVHSVMHRYGWTCVDKITSSAYDSAFLFVRNDSTMEPVEEDEDEGWEGGEEGEGGEGGGEDGEGGGEGGEGGGEGGEEGKGGEGGGEDGEGGGEDGEEGGEDEEHNEEDRLYLGFQMPNEDVPKTADHYPVWDVDQTCAVCKYKFKRDDIISDSSKFNSVFYCN